MSRRDGMGPMGLGALTGRGSGLCTGTGARGGTGQGCGFGRGFGRGGGGSLGSESLRYLLELLPSYARSWNQGPRATPSASRVLASRRSTYASVTSSGRSRG
jgi:hypothetical protein